MLSLTWLDELCAFLSPEQMEVNESPHPLGNSGAVTVYPQTEEEIAAVLRYADRQGKKVVVMGRGTKRGFGGQREQADILLSLENYAGIVEHAAADMMVTVKAGTVFGDLQRELAPYRQKVALDPFWPDEATVGGVIAANDSGPKRLGYGAARDLVIGLRIVYPNGTVIRSGGKVVKNVAGYDMNKLFIGAMGTLGVLSEVTLKLRPLAKYESVVLLSFPSGDVQSIHSFAVSFLDTMMEPICFELLTPTLAERLTGRPVYTLVIGFEDVEKAVHYQEQWVERLCPKAASMAVLAGEEAEAFWRTFYTIAPNGRLTTSGGGVEAAVKIGVVNLDVLSVLRESELIADRCHVQIEAHGGLGHGLCQAYVRGSEEGVIAAVEELRQMAVRLGGYAVVRHLPFFLRQRIDVWGGKPAYFFLLEGIKRKIDPNKTVNDQRFIGGI
ncbi:MULTISPECIES: FAD-binding oxidoreductase [Geobacillus]|jgi:glycolate oxidase FAD binding subunit|uniref:FAD-binding oxidoreductase n=1 Tax=Geobacillus TaxID=129337 RepID=UPI00017E462B|nr:MULTISPECIES: FAD-binding oxidoreductase [Geobacillus]ARP42509.1 Glycolate oxidase subunit GlcD [Geobacillus thermodenitrificans]ATO36163.1 FAD-binding oxidoreductase [Geobacillus thermodenitrificans]KQB93583.1 lactate dehydrogenase [Geobacillus sp. PA-3]MED0661557.1 FAD-binding oxidoreductase [Geobacillus thermodenitrificans]